MRLGEMSLVQEYQKQWARFRQETIGHSHVMSALRIEEKALTEKDDYQLVVGEYDSEKYLHETAKKYIQEIANLAEKEFSPKDACIQIDYEELYDSYLPDKYAENKCYNDLSLDDIWQALDKKYSGQNGVDSAYKKIASTIIDEFRLSADKVPVKKAGYFSLNKSIYIDSFDKKYGKNRLNYGTKDDIIKLLKALHAFAGWLDDTQIQWSINGYINRLWNSTHDQDHIQSREKIKLGNDIVIITYLTRFEFRFSPEVTSKLQIFLSTFAAHAFKKSA